MKRVIKRSELNYLQRVVPPKGAGHLQECVSLMRSVVRGWGASHYYQGIGLLDLNSAIAYLLRTPPNLEEAEQVIKNLYPHFTRFPDIDNALRMANLRVQAYRLENDLFEVTDD